MEQLPAYLKPDIDNKELYPIFNNDKIDIILLNNEI